VVAANGPLVAGSGGSRPLVSFSPRSAQTFNAGALKSALRSGDQIGSVLSSSRRIQIMRIGIDGIPLATPKSGIGHYTYELARSIAGLLPSDRLELVAPVPIELTAEHPETELPPNLHAVHAPLNPLRRRWWTLGLPLYARQNRLALFHGTNYNLPLWKPCPTVVTIHDLSLLLHPNTHQEHLVARAKRRLPVMTRLATRIVTDSESVKREICEHLNVHPERVTSVALAPRQVFRPMSAADGREVRRRFRVLDEFILFVGTVEPRKNLLTLVRAFEDLLRTTDLKPQLVIAGQRGWMSDELFALIEQGSLRDHVRFLGYVADEDLRALYSSCRVAVYPSLYEGFGLPPLEAMACGAPVITSRIPVIMETSEHAARLINPTDTEELTAAMVELLTDADARAQLARAGLKRAAEYTWERTARQTLAVYEEVLNSAGRGHQTSRATT
jgi:glycosyltransferase involved in cell wall biosynthesis